MEQKLNALKLAIMEILSQVTAIEYEWKQITASTQLPNQNKRPHATTSNWAEEEALWYVRRNNRIENDSEPLENLAAGQRYEAEQEMPDVDFQEGYEFKAKKHTRESILEWYRRLRTAVNEQRLNPFLTAQALDTLFEKLKRKFKDIQTPNGMALRLALEDFNALQKIFQGVDAFLNAKQGSNNLNL